jgi:hypothetical protein
MPRRLSLSAAAAAVALAVALAVIAPAPPAHADSLVVADARGGTLKPGDAIDAARPIKLEAGQRLTLIAPNGAMIKLSGPFEGVPDPSGERSGSVADSLLKLASQTSQSSATLGTVRAAETVVPLPEPWLVDVSASGHRCVQEGTSVVFWRPAATVEQILQLSPTDHAWQGQAKWPAGQDRLGMPPSFQAQDEQAYVVAIEAATATVTLHVIPPAIDTDAMRAAWMLDRGCTGQARVLISRLK